MESISVNPTLSEAKIDPQDTEQTLYVKLDNPINGFTHAVIKKGFVSYQLGKQSGSDIELEDFVRRADFDVSGGTSIKKAFGDAVNADLLQEEII